MRTFSRHGTCRRTAFARIYSPVPVTQILWWKCNHAILPVFSGILLLCCLLLTSCTLFSSGLSSPHASPTTSASTYSGPADQPAVNGTVDHPVVSLGCGHRSPVAPGTSANQTLAVAPADSYGFSTRLYRVHVPVEYQDTVPAPLVLYFHGYGGTAASADNGSGFSTLADQHDFIVAYGQGLPDGEGGVPFWASVGPIDYGINDVHYVSLMLDDLQSKLCIDAHRIFVTGFSNGGGMSAYLACSLAGRIAAVAPVSGNYYAIPGGCRPGRSVPILEIHGSADTIVPYQGIPASLNPSWPLPSIPQWLHGWIMRDSCRQGPVTFLHTAQVMGEQWTNCQGGAGIVHYLIEGGGHAWPSTLGNRPSLEVMWDFFQAHPLPE